MGEQKENPFQHQRGRSRTISKRKPRKEPDQTIRENTEDTTEQSPVFRTGMGKIKD